MILGGLLVIGGSFTVSAEMTPLTPNQMSTVTGKEGLIVAGDVFGPADNYPVTINGINLDVDGSEGLVIAMPQRGSEPSPDAGRAASLSGMKLNVDQQEGLVMDLPSGSFDVTVEEIHFGEYWDSLEGVISTTSIWMELA